MKTIVTVREYARLTVDPVGTTSLDCAQVSVTAFDWLCSLNSTFSRAGASLVQVEDRRWLRLDNYVGVLETPCGTLLEVPPKHVSDTESASSSRSLLRRMIAAALDLPIREAWETDLQLFDAPLSEWVMGQYLSALDRLVKRGVRSDYLRIESTERYLRGQLDVVRQIRQPPGRQNQFNIRHDIYSPNRAENRLLKSAVEIICKQTRSTSNWRLAQELRSTLDEITASLNLDDDFRQWRNDRLMAHYQPVRPWCELVLRQQIPVAVTGEWQGVSMLFPMEKLFERYVAVALRSSLPPNAKLSAQSRSTWLCSHAGDRMFRLQPDIVIEQDNQLWVLDTKWKQLDASDRLGNYGLSQGDFYQLLAYGKNYLDGKGEMVLIYPVCETFSAPLPPFHFDGSLSLHVLPFDLDQRALIGCESTSLPALTTLRSARHGSYGQRMAA